MKPWKKTRRQRRRTEARKELNRTNRALQRSDKWLRPLMAQLIIKPGVMSCEHPKPGRFLVEEFGGDVYGGEGPMPPDWFPMEATDSEALTEALNRGFLPPWPAEVG